MIVYATLPGGRYVPFAEGLAASPAGASLAAYANLTNRCNCACTFCLRGKKDMRAEASLWLGGREPSEVEVWAELAALPRERVSEVVFCGFGEPTLRLDALLGLLRRIKAAHPDLPTRLNTNGLAELERGGPVAPLFEGLLDTVSISLNASTPERYLALTRARFGLPSWEGMLAFAEHCRAYVPRVVLTVVDHVEDAAEIEACRALCEARGLELRVRAYEDS